jgi:hypothetical protein
MAAQQIFLLLASLLAFAALGQSQIYSETRPVYGLFAYNEKHTWLTISNTTGENIVGIVQLLSGGCILATYKGVPKYISLRCNTNKYGTITIDTFDPTNAANCVGYSDQYGTDPIEIDDGALLTDIYGVGTKVRATCSLTIDYDRTFFEQFRMVEKFYYGACPPYGQAEDALSLAAISYFKSPVPSASFQVFGNNSRTLEYPCTTTLRNSFACNSNNCSVITADVHARAQYPNGAGVSLDFVLRTMPFGAPQQPPVTVVPTDKSSLAAWVIWIILLSLNGVLVLGGTVTSHTSKYVH